MGRQICVITSLLLCVFLFRIPSPSSSSIEDTYPWNLEMIGAENAHRITQGSANVTVAVIDSGIDFSIADLAGREWLNPLEVPNNGLDDDSNNYIDDVRGWDFVENDFNPSPVPSGHWHGTFVAGILSAQEGGQIDLLGIAPGIKIMDLRVLDANNAFSVEDWPNLAAAFYYATDMGASVINFSIYSYGPPPSFFLEAIEYARDNDVFIVGITGNNFDGEEDNSIQYPGKYDAIMAVSAVSTDASHIYWSREGTENEICAPGNGIQSTVPSTMLPFTGMGTSFSAPLVAGTAALMQSVNANLSVSHVRDLLKQTATDLGDPGRDNTYGWGLLNASLAVQRAVNVSVSDENPTTSSSPHLGLKDRKSVV